MAAPPSFDLRLVRTRMLSPTVRELAFERVDALPVSFEAGQWVSLVLPLPSGEGRRAYSVASAPDGSPSLALAITKVEGGPGSTYLHALEPGATVRASGPQGFFTRPESARSPSLFIGTGTGVTPLRSMILDALAKGDASPMTLLFGVRHPDDRLYADEFSELSARHPNFRVEYKLSKPPTGWMGRQGYVQAHVEELWRDLEAKGAGVPHGYICGLERMVSAVRERLRKEMGVERKQVHSERYD